MTMLGLPYARAEVTDDGRYAVRCPECGLLCSGVSPDEVDPEDAITKGAGESYARHYQEHDKAKAEAVDRFMDRLRAFHRAGMALVEAWAGDGFNADEVAPLPEDLAPTLSMDEWLDELLAHYEGNLTEAPDPDAADDHIERVAAVEENMRTDADAIGEGRMPDPGYDFDAEGVVERVLASYKVTVDPTAPPSWLVVSPDEAAYLFDVYVGRIESGREERRRQSLTLEASVALGRYEILVDLLKGRFPAASIQGFPDLHDYSDANEYGGLCAEFAQQGIDFAAEVQDRLHNWIVEGGLQA